MQKHTRSFSRFQAALIIIFLILIFTGCSSGGGESSPEDGYNPDPGTPTPDVTSRPSSEWTFMVYMCSDNSLEFYDYLDILEMQDVGSTDSVNIIVQWDRKGLDQTLDWEGCRRYYVTKTDYVGGNTGVHSDMLEELGDVNMGDPQALVEFIQWGKLNFPANKYAVILWNHGNGWRSGQDGSSKGICYDDTSNDYLTDAELEWAFYETSGGNNNKIELIGMDACLMGQLEIAYSLRNYAKYMAFSQMSEPGEGWPYDSILRPLTENPTMNGADLGTVVVDAYRDFYTSTSGLSMSAINLSAVGTLASKIDAFSQTALNNMNYYGYILRDCSDQAASLDDTYTDYKDISEYFSIVSANIGSENLKIAADEVIRSLGDVVIKEYHDSTYNCSGLSIWLPDYSNYCNYYANYQLLSFAYDTWWDEFIGEMQNY